MKTCFETSFLNLLSFPSYINRRVPCADVLGCQYLFQHHIKQYKNMWKVTEYFSCRKVSIHCCLNKSRTSCYPAYQLITVIVYSTLQMLQPTLEKYGLWRVESYFDVFSFFHRLPYSKLGQLKKLALQCSRDLQG